MGDRVITSDLVDAIASDLVRVKHTGLSSYINLPLVYPSGSSITVKVDAVEHGVRISDAGFCFREIERLGGERSFKRTANTFAHECQIEVGSRTIFVDVPPEQAASAVSDVGLVSWRVADKICSKILTDNEEEVADILRQRLDSIFGHNRVRSQKDISGSSSWKWQVSAIVETDSTTAVFQAVSPSGQSINKASTAFFDLAGLDAPPRLIAVVTDRKSFGARLGILSRVGMILEAGDSDQNYRKKVA